MGNEITSDNPMNVFKLIKSKKSYREFNISTLSLMMAIICLPAKGMDLSTQSDLADSNLSASLFANASNVSIISQLGNNNRAVVSQSGDNLVAITEVGNSNLANVRQDGLGNSAIVTQIGNGNDIEITQIGSFNTAITTQIGGTGYKVEQIGDNMTVHITQFAY